MDSNVNPRNKVLNMLTETLESGRLSHLVIGDMFRDERYSERDRAFIMKLYLGVLERLVFLDFHIEGCSKVPVKKIKPVIKNILRLSVYQMFFMDSVPERAAINEGVKLTEKRKFSNLKGYVNGVLRAVQRQGVRSDLPENISLAAPLWLYEKLCSDLGKEKAEEFLRAALEGSREMSVMLNTSKASLEDIRSELEADGCTVSLSDDGTSRIAPKGSIEDLNAFKKGLIYIQSANSMKAAKKAFELCSDIKEPLIIDVCATPGGKSIDMALLFPEGHIISGDRSEEKRLLIEENKSRLGLSNIETRVWDGEISDETLAGKADIVLVDAPCSGIGVIAGKPDIKYRLKKEDIKELAMLQRSILKASAGYVKPKGVLIYSTCTLTREENEENATWLLESGGFSPEGSCVYTLSEGGADGFYIAAFRKN